MDKTTEPISVMILDREYQFASDPEERKDLKAAAEFLDERMRSIKGVGRLMTLERVAVMTALNLSNELLKMQTHEKNRGEKFDSRIRILADELDSALEG